jgi:glycosyltransferase involved in cell wall biosynthesis
MDVFFLTTSGEGFGIPIIEAMSCEIPVIATDYTTTYELIEEDGKCGESAKLLGEITGSWMVERGIMDCEDAASKIEKLYKNPVLSKKYGSVGREKVLKFYNWDKVIDDWDAYFTRLANK